MARWVKFECVSMCQVISDRPFVLFWIFTCFTQRHIRWKKDSQCHSQTAWRTWRICYRAEFEKITQCIWCAFDATNIIHQPKITHPQPRDPEFIFSLNPLVKPYFTTLSPRHGTLTAQTFSKVKVVPEQRAGTVTGHSCGKDYSLNFKHYDQSTNPPDAAMKTNMKTNNILSVLNREQWLITLFQNDLNFVSGWLCAGRLIEGRAQENGDPSNDVYFSLMARWYP